MFTFGSLFSGIGGIDLGLERAGMQCVWQVEKDEFCRKILAKHWPSIPQFDDICTFPPSKNNPKKYQCDLLAGGFPCQDVSTTSTTSATKGIHGERTGLWTEYIRTISVLRPRYVLMENVTGLFHYNIERIFGAMAEIGYDSEWQIIPASAFGAPHNRNRIFILAYPSGTFLERIITDSSRQRSSSGYKGNQKNGDRKGVCTNIRSNTSHGTTKSWWSVEPKMDRMVYGISRRMVRPAIKALGNAVVPQVAQWIGEQILKADKTLL